MTYPPEDGSYEGGQSSVNAYETSPYITEDSIDIDEAAQTGDATSCRLLLGHGVNVNETDVSGNTPLMFALGNGNLTQAQEYWVVKALLASGAGVGAKNRFGQTALDSAHRSRFEQSLPGVIHLLKDAGAAGK